MNPIIVTTIIATASFILTVFAATWLNNRANDKRMEDFKLYIDARFEAVRAEINATRTELRAEINATRTELKAETRSLGDRLDRIERQLEALFKPARSGD